ncbi:MAG: hypothetical protein ACETWG_11355 [Candidatus Neomarinimicrobiota bacterium]
MLALFGLGCVGRPGGSAPSNLPYFQEFQVSAQLLADAAAKAVRSSSYDLELDTRRTTPNQLITLHRPLPKRGLKQLAYPGRPGIWGKMLHADLHVLVSIRLSYARPEYSRVTIQPVFLVYISRWRDRRQWIQWRSNGTLERELLSLIEAYLQPEGLK